MASAASPNRGLNSELFEGMTDGKYKKVVQDRGQAESSTYNSRKDLDDVWHGIHEASFKVLPDGRTVHTPDYSSTDIVNSTGF